MKKIKFKASQLVYDFGDIMKAARESKITLPEGSNVIKGFKN
jgi:hypothetical protein